jgi:hypothetical protein
VLEETIPEEGLVRVEKCLLRQADWSESRGTKYDANKTL